MGKTPEARLDSADDERNIAPKLADAVAIHDRRPVRSLSRFAARGIGVFAALLSGRRVRAHHGVEVAGRYEDADPGTAEGEKVFWSPPVRLGDDSHPKSFRFENPGDNRVPETRMIHVCVSGDKCKIDPVPAPFGHIL